MKGHVGRNGEVHPSAVETYEKVKAATEKRKSLIDAGLVDPMDIDNDEITEVFGPDKGQSGLLVYSSHTSKAQTLQANLATSVMAAKG
ncbi:hypothetical protein MKW94_022136, partial [Papaver nudicaule]|nr:hypothetical protein [Papaver nudicaule]